MPACATLTKRLSKQNINSMIRLRKLRVNWVKLPFCLSDVWCGWPHWALIGWNISKRFGNFEAQVFKFFANFDELCEFSPKKLFLDAKLNLLLSCIWISDMSEMVNTKNFLKFLKIDLMSISSCFAGWKTQIFRRMVES